MTSTLASTQFNAYRAPKVDLPVILLDPEYAGTVGILETHNGVYFNAVVREKAGFMTSAPKTGVGAAVWHDKESGLWVTDYLALSGNRVVFDTNHGLVPALSMAVLCASEQGHERGLW